MPPKRSNPEATLYRRAVLTPCLSAFISAVMVYWYELQTYQGMDIERAEAAAAAMALIVYFAIHTMYTGLFVTLMRWKHEEKMAELQTPTPREKLIVQVRDEHGNLRSGEYLTDARVAWVSNDKLAEICAAIVRAGEYNLRVVESVATRKVYRSMTAELIRCNYAKWNNPAHHQQGVEITGRGWFWIRERAKRYSPTGLRKSCELSGLRLTTHAHAGHARERVG